MKAIANGRIVLKDRILEGQYLIFDKKIAAISDTAADCDVIDAQGGYVTAGLIDLHIHGYMGADASDGKVSSISAIAEGIARNGVTSFMPTTMTLGYDRLSAAFGAVREYLKAPSDYGARVLGINAEGPYLSAEKRGAHDIALLRKPDAKFILDNSDVVRLTTVAPELPGAMEFIRELTEKGVRVAVGHTAADHDIIEKAVGNGATEATHIFNAMNIGSHRAPGGVIAALCDDRLYSELIADGFHVHPAFFKVLRRMKGDHLVLITDCTRAGGMGDGEFELGGQTMQVNGIKCLLPDGTIAGSVLTLNMAVKNMIEYGGADVCEAVSMATINPASASGIDAITGELKPGLTADIAIFDSDFNAKMTIVGGRTIYERI